jgi:hypothetical protein
MYLAAMNLIAQKKNLTLAAKIPAYPIVIVGVLMDFLLNVTVCTALFLELPKEWLITMRLKRHLDEMSDMNSPVTWRQSIALWICSNLLDPFDARGFHCRNWNRGKD